MVPPKVLSFYLIGPYNDGDIVRESYDGDNRESMFGEIYGNKAYPL